MVYWFSFERTAVYRLHSAEKPIKSGALGQFKPALLGLHKKNDKIFFVVTQDIVEMVV